MMGILYSVIASLLWSLNPAVIQRYKYVIRPMLFIGLRGIFAVLGLLPIVLILRHNLLLSSMSITTILFIIVSAVIGPGIGDAAYAMSIKLIGGSLAVIIGYTYMFVAQLLATLFLGEEITLLLLAGTAIVFIGIVLAFYRDGDSSIQRDSIALGILYATISSISWGIASFMIKLIYNDIPDPIIITLIRLSIVAFLFTSMGVREIKLFNEVKEQIIPAVITGILGWSLGVPLYVYAIGVLGVSKAVVATAITPIVSQITIAIVNRMKISLRYVASSFLVTIGITLLALDIR